MTDKTSICGRAAMAAGTVVVFIMFLAALAAIGLFRLVGLGTANNHNLQE